MHTFPRSTLRRTATTLAIGLLPLSFVACDEPGEPLAPGQTAAFSKGTPGKPGTAPQRGRIAFSAYLTGNFEIYTVNEDGSGLLRLTYDAATDMHPAASPDGKKIVWVRDTNGASELFSMNADGSLPRQLTTLNGTLSAVRYPAYSPDGKKIAFTGMIAGTSNWEVFVMNANGANVVRITDQPGYDGQPSWSPDGKQLAIASQGGETIAHVNITIMNADGTGASIVATCALECSTPAWSPDGQRIAYSDLYSLRMLLIESGVDVALVDDGIAPAWSPDGVKIAYTATVGAVYGLHTVNADGTGVFAVPNGHNAGIDAAWSRR